MLLTLYLDISSPSDFWHDLLLLTVLGMSTTLFAGFIGAFVAYWIFHKQRAQKEIAYEVQSDTRIVNVEEEVKDRVEILFDGNHVEDMSLLTSKVRNIGNIAVKREDYAEPLIFEFEGRKVVSADIIDMKPSDLIDPKDLKTFLTIEPDSIRLANFLLNPKDEITIKVLLTGNGNYVQARARIANGKLTKSNISNQVTYIKLSSFVIPIITLLLFLSLAPLFISLFPFDQTNMHSFISIFISIIIFVITLFLSIIFSFTIYSIIRLSEKTGKKIRW